MMPRVDFGLTALIGLLVPALLLFVIAVLSDSVPKRLGLVALGVSSILIGIMAYMGRHGGPFYATTLLLVAAIALLLIGAIILVSSSYPGLAHATTSSLTISRISPTQLRIGFVSGLISITLLNLVSVIFAEAVPRIILLGVSAGLSLALAIIMLVLGRTFFPQR